MRKLIPFLVILSPIAHSQSHLDKKIPVTMANIRGQQELYQNGWKFISSSDKALQYAVDNGVKSSGQVILELMNDLSKNNNELKVETSQIVSKALQSAKSFYNSGTDNSQKIHHTGDKIANQLYKTSKDLTSKSWATFVSGYLTLTKRTEADRNALLNVPGNYFSGLKKDWSNFKESLGPLELQSSKSIVNHWDQTLKHAQIEFEKEYQKSSEQTNSLKALPYVIWGNLKFIYHSIIKPSSQTASDVGVQSANLALKAITYPIAGTIIWGKQTVLATGLTFYHSSSGIYKIFSPTIEGGLLAGLSLSSLIGSGATSLATSGVGAINQVATTALSPAWGVANATGNTLYSSGKYVANVTYDLSRRSSAVLFNVASSGVVLGYNALTAVPSQLLLSSINVAYFLAWDGPKLTLYAITGNQAGDIPVGTTIDLKSLKESRSYEFLELNVDQEVLKKVIERLPKDLNGQ